MSTSQHPSTDSTTDATSERDDAAASGPRLILASQSPARAQLLRAAGLRFEQLVSGVDEDAALAAAEATRGHRLDPAQTALVLARAKAKAVARLPEAAGALVLGCDSVFELDGRPYGKPHTPEVARERIAGMSGRTGTLHTGHWLIRAGGVGADDRGDAAGDGEIRSAEVTFAELSPEQIRAYVATGEPLEVAGSFTLDGYGAAFIHEVRGEPNTVLGLSVSALRELLGRHGLNIAELWVSRT